MPNLIINTILLITFVMMSAFALYVKLRQDTNTRERFAFYALAGVTSLGTLTIKSLSEHESVWSSIGNLARAAAGQPPDRAGPPPWSDHALMVVVFISACFFISSLYRNWHGKFSKADDDLRRKHRDRNWAMAGIADAYRRLSRHPAPEPFTRVEQQFRPQRLDVPGLLTWHVQAKELYLLRNRSFRFDSDFGWRDDHRCWIGEDIISNRVIVLYCSAEPPQDRSLSDFVAYSKEIAGGRPVECHMAIRDGGEILLNLPQKIIDGFTIHCETRESLLNNLVDFRDYYTNIRDRVERRPLSETDIPIKSAYVESQIEDETGELIAVPLEEFLTTWLEEPSRRQLALLGELWAGQKHRCANVCVPPHQPTFARDSSSDNHRTQRAESAKSNPRRYPGILGTSLRHKRARPYAAYKSQAAFC